MVALAKSKDAVFKAVADVTRRRMIDLLTEHETAACDLVRHFDMSQPAVSQHLRVLLDAGLVKVRESGRHRFYAADPAGLKAVYDWVAHYENFWKSKLASLGTYLDQQNNKGRKS